MRKRRPLAHYTIELAADVQGGRAVYRSELWYLAFSGWMVASTRWVSTKQWARRDGRAWLKAPD